MLDRYIRGTRNFVMKCTKKLPELYKEMYSVNKERSTFFSRKALDDFLEKILARFTDPVSAKSCCDYVENGNIGDIFVKSLSKDELDNQFFIEVSNELKISDVVSRSHSEDRLMCIPTRMLREKKLKFTNQPKSSEYQQNVLKVEDNLILNRNSSRISEFREINYEKKFLAGDIDAYVLCVYCVLRIYYDREYEKKLVKRSCENFLRITAFEKYQKNHCTEVKINWLEKSKFQYESSKSNIFNKCMACFHLINVHDRIDFRLLNIQTKEYTKDHGEKLPSKGFKSGLCAVRKNKKSDSPFNDESMTDEDEIIVLEDDMNKIQAISKRIDRDFPFSVCVESGYLNNSRLEGLLYDLSKVRLYSGKLREGIQVLRKYQGEFYGRNINKNSDSKLDFIKNNLESPNFHACQMYKSSPRKSRKHQLETTKKVLDSNENTTERFNQYVKAYIASDSQDPVNFDDDSSKPLTWPETRTDMDRKRDLVLSKLNCFGKKVYNSFEKVEYKNCQTITPVKTNRHLNIEKNFNRNMNEDVEARCSNKCDVLNSCKDNRIWPINDADCMKNTKKTSGCIQNHFNDTATYQESNSSIKYIDVKLSISSKHTAQFDCFSSHKNVKGIDFSNPSKQMIQTKASDLQKKPEYFNLSIPAKDKTQNNSLHSLQSSNETNCSVPLEQTKLSDRADSSKDPKSIGLTNSCNFIRKSEGTDYFLESNDMKSIMPKKSIAAHLLNTGENFNHNLTKYCESKDPKDLLAKSCLTKPGFSSTIHYSETSDNPLNDACKKNPKTSFHPSPSSYKDSEKGSCKKNTLDINKNSLNNNDFYDHFNAQDNTIIFENTSIPRNHVSFYSENADQSKCKDISFKNIDQNHEMFTQKSHHKYDETVNEHKFTKKPLNLNMPMDSKSSKREKLLLIDNNQRRNSADLALLIANDATKVRGLSHHIDNYEKKCTSNKSIRDKFYSYQNKSNRNGIESTLITKLSTQNNSPAFKRLESFSESSKYSNKESSTTNCRKISTLVNLKCKDADSLNFTESKLRHRFCRKKVESLIEDSDSLSFEIESEELPLDPLTINEGMYNDLYGQTYDDIDESPNNQLRNAFRCESAGFDINYSEREKATKLRNNSLKSDQYRSETSSDDFISLNPVVYQQKEDKMICTSGLNSLHDESSKHISSKIHPSLTNRQIERKVLKVIKIVKRDMLSKNMIQKRVDPRNSSTIAFRTVQNISSVDSNSVIIKTPNSFENKHHQIGKNRQIKNHSVNNQTKLNPTHTSIYQENASMCSKTDLQKFVEPTNPEKASNNTLKIDSKDSKMKETAAFDKSTDSNSGEKINAIHTLSNSKIYGVPDRVISKEPNVKKPSETNSVGCLEPKTDLITKESIKNTKMSLDLSEDLKTMCLKTLDMKKIKQPHGFENRSTDIENLESRQLQNDQCFVNLTSNPENFTSASFVHIMDPQNKEITNDLSDHTLSRMNGYSKSKHIGPDMFSNVLDLQNNQKLAINDHERVNKNDQNRENPFSTPLKRLSNALEARENKLSKNSNFNTIFVSDIKEYTNAHHVKNKTSSTKRNDVDETNNFGYSDRNPLSKYEKRDFYTPNTKENITDRHTETVRFKRNSVNSPYISPQNVINSGVIARKPIHSEINSGDFSTDNSTNSQIFKNHKSEYYRNPPPFSHFKPQTSKEVNISIKRPSEYLLSSPKTIKDENVCFGSGEFNKKNTFQENKKCYILTQSTAHHKDMGVFCRRDSVSVDIPIPSKKRKSLCFLSQQNDTDSSPLQSPFDSENAYLPNEKYFRPFSSAGITSSQLLYGYPATRAQNLRKCLLGPRSFAHHSFCGSEFDVIGSGIILGKIIGQRSGYDHGTVDSECCTNGQNVKSILKNTDDDIFHSQKDESNDFYDLNRNFESNKSTYMTAFDSPAPSLNEIDSQSDELEGSNGFELADLLSFDNLSTFDYNLTDQKEKYNLFDLPEDLSKSCLLDQNIEISPDRSKSRGPSELDINSLYSTPQSQDGYAEDEDSLCNSISNESTVFYNFHECRGTIQNNISAQRLNFNNKNKLINPENESQEVSNESRESTLTNLDFTEAVCKPKSQDHYVILYAKNASSLCSESFQNDDLLKPNTEQRQTTPSDYFLNCNDINSKTTKFKTSDSYSSPICQKKTQPAEHFKNTGSNQEAQDSDVHDNPIHRFNFANPPYKYHMQYQNRTRSTLHTTQSTNDDSETILNKPNHYPLATISSNGRPYEYEISRPRSYTPLSAVIRSVDEVYSRAAVHMDGRRTDNLSDVYLQPIRSSTKFCDLEDHRSQYQAGAVVSKAEISSNIGFPDRTQTDYSYSPEYISHFSKSTYLHDGKNVENEKFINDITLYRKFSRDQQQISKNSKNSDISVINSKTKHDFIFNSSSSTSIPIKKENSCALSQLTQNAREMCQNTQIAISGSCQHHAYENAKVESINFHQNFKNPNKSDFWLIKNNMPLQKSQDVLSKDGLNSNINNDNFESPLKASLLRLQGCKSKVSTANVPLIVSTDAEGSRYIQSKILAFGYRDVLWFYGCIRDSLERLACDLFGNYVVQKMITWDNKRLIHAIIKNCLQFEVGLPGDVEGATNSKEKVFLDDVNGTCLNHKKNTLLDTTTPNPKFQSNRISHMINLSKNQTASRCNDQNLNISDRLNEVSVREDAFLDLSRSVITHNRNEDDILAVISSDMMLLLQKYTLSLAKDNYGCRVIQKALESPLGVLLFLDTISDNVGKLIDDNNGNHVVQKAADVTLSILFCSSDTSSDLNCPSNLEFKNDQALAKGSGFSIKNPLSSRQVSKSHFQDSSCSNTNSQEPDPKSSSNINFHHYSSENDSPNLKSNLNSHDSDISESMKKHFVFAVHEKIASFRSNLVNLFTTTGTKYLNHRFGCRVVQRVIENCSDTELSTILNACIIPSVDNLITDQYGNYVLQHILTFKRNNMRLTMQNKIDEEKYKDYKTIIDEIYKSNKSRKIQTEDEMLSNQSINETQSPLDSSKSQNNQFASKSMSKNVGLNNSTIQSQKLQKNAPNSFFKSVNLRDLIANPLLYKKIPWYSEKVLQKFKIMQTKSLLQYSTHKFASNVIEKVIEQNLDVIMSQLTAIYNTRPLIITMACDRFGNYVVQRIVEQNNYVLNDLLRTHANHLKKSEYATHILTKLNKNYHL